jgi:hypothetical protein
MTEVNTSSAGLPTTIPAWMTALDMSGAQHYGYADLRGWLTFSGLPDEIQRQLDQTANFDWEHRDWLHRPRTRPATPAERLLLTWLGFGVPPNLDTVVRYISGSVRRCEWPQLEQQREGMQ